MSKKSESGISRRGFLKWGTAAAALSTGLTACGSDSDDAVIAGGNGLMDNPDPILEGGEWVTAACPTCSGFRCVNRVYMKDGIAVRQKTDDSPYPNTLETPVHRACVKGRNMRWQVFSPDRIKYPMKRKSWNPGGANFAPELRGRDDWERISWDEALTYIYNECKRIGDKYPTANHANAGSPFLNLGTSDEPTFLNVAGYGSTALWGQSSLGASPAVTNFITGGPFIAFMGGSYDRFTTMENMKLLVLWGNNPTWGSYSNKQLYIREMREKYGVKVITVDPWFNPGNNALADSWVPCRPGTDSALVLGIAHELITNTALDGVDYQFLADYTVGFDEDSMPVYAKDGVTPLKDKNDVSLIEEVTPGVWKHKDRKNNFKDYVLGVGDHAPAKTPAWASAICGADEQTIRDFAAELAKYRGATTIYTTPAAARSYNGGLFIQGVLTLGFMLGNFGKPGATVAGIGFPGGAVTNPTGISPMNGTYFNSLAKRVKTVTNYSISTNPILPNPKCAFPYGERFMSFSLDTNYSPTRYYGCAMAEAWDFVITGKHKNFTNNNWSDEVIDGMGYKNQQIRAMIKLHGTNTLNNVVNARRGIEAFRHEKVEFVMVQDVVFNATAQHADIVLPWVSLWELDGQVNYQNPEMLIGNAERVIPPMFEARESAWVDEELWKMFDPTFVNPVAYSQKQTSFAYLANAQVSDGISTEPVISFTNDDLATLGISPEFMTHDEQQWDPSITAFETVTVTADLSNGRISYQDFKKQGFYKINFNENMRRNVTPPFINNLVQLGTVTGKIELYSHKLKEYYENFGFTTIAPILKYQESKRGYEEAQREPEYPFQHINVIALARVLSRPASPSLHEVFDDGLYINPVDAKKIKVDIQTGDTVLVTSKGGGQSLMRVIVTNTIMPGVTMSPAGSMIDVGEDGIDRGGNANFLSEGLLCGQGQEAFNTCLVKVDAWDGEPLTPGYKRTTASMAAKIANVK